MDTGDASPTAYDQVLYPATVYPETHPDRLATVGTLRGMQPAPVNKCRVLELGCGTGENLLALAFNFPSSEFIGLDSARHPVALGQHSIAELGFTNIQLHPLDLCEASRERFGSFDYIIAHGLYSWVPPFVRERVLAICRELTTPQGIAYVSYNAYPGNHLRDLARGIIRFHTARSGRPSEKVERARGILRFLAESRLTPNAYVTTLRAELERVAKQRDEVFFHDDLGEINQAFYFHEFIAAAHRHDLRFVGEASPDDLHPENLTPEVVSKLGELEKEDEIIREQYKDFVLGRAFRKTLLCRHEVELAPAFLTEGISTFHASCDAIPVEWNEDVEARGALFRRPSGAELRTDHELVTAALRRLCAEWPCAVAFDVVLERARREVTNSKETISLEEQTALLADAWKRAYQNGFIQLHVTSPRVMNKVSERPECSALARFQLSRTEVATSQLHKRVRFEDPLSRDVAQLLDGTRDLEAITQTVLQSIRTGQAELRENKMVVAEPDRIARLIKQQVREVLEALAKEGLLIG
jgi:methyltransferase-like protein/cyclopropane fatty-acyl-phospholipid synthase-like methyltransferase